MTLGAASDTVTLTSPVFPCGAGIPFYTYLRAKSSGQAARLTVTLKYFTNNGTTANGSVVLNQTTGLPAAYAEYGSLVTPPSGTCYAQLNWTVDTAADTVWADEVRSSRLPSNVLSQLGGTANGLVTINPLTTTATDYGSLTVTRNTTHTGGTAGSVNTALRAIGTVGSGVTDYEWMMLAQINNYATKGQNVAFYGQGNKFAAGPTWAGVLEVQEQTGTADPNSGTLGLEIDIDAVGTDANGQRIGIDIVLRRPTSYATAASPHAYAGLRFQGESGVSWYDNFITTISGQIATHGINFTTAQIQGYALYLAKDQKIALETTGANTLSYGSAFGGVLLTTSGGLGVQLPALGTSSGNSFKALSLVATDTNTDALNVNLGRIAAGSSWTSAAWSIGRVVDGTTVGTSMAFLQAGLQLSGAIGFNNAAPVGKGSVSAALPTDGSASPAQLATAYNSLRTALIAVGLVQ